MAAAMTVRTHSALKKPLKQEAEPSDTTLHFFTANPLFPNW
ncbi:hypothetical protein S7335_3797 [Synechococcus sp. PCC 7335]|nr:hypothetical protein S7335_3797 [Synechococcus sp. PCC 7335]